MDFQKEWLVWAIDFVQTDISEFNLMKKHSLFQRLKWFASSDFYSSFDPFGKSIQFSPFQMDEWKRTAPDIQKALREFIDQMTTTRASYELPELTSFIRSEGTMTRDPRVYFQTHSIPKDPIPKNWAILNLSRLLQGLEMHVIGKCKECQKYFLNFSLREKIYCSSQCASRDLARTRQERWSETKYRAYLDKQNKLSMKNYVEKRKAKGLKVRHRPRRRGSKRIPKIL